MADTAAELRELSDAELVEKHDEYKQELFNPVSYTHLTLPTTERV